jgi:hypothetical protein
MNENTTTAAPVRTEFDRGLELLRDLKRAAAQYDVSKMGPSIPEHHERALGNAEFNLCAWLREHGEKLFALAARERATK